MTQGGRNAGSALRTLSSSTRQRTQAPARQPVSNPSASSTDYIILARVIERAGNLPERALVAVKRGRTHATCCVRSRLEAGPRQHLSLKEPFVSKNNQETWRRRVAPSTFVHRAFSKNSQRLARTNPLPAILDRGPTTNVSCRASPSSVLSNFPRNSTA